MDHLRPYFPVGTDFFFFKKRSFSWMYYMYLPDGWHGMYLQHPKAHIHVLNSVILDPAQDALQWVDQEAVTVGGRRPRPRGVTASHVGCFEHSKEEQRLLKLAVLQWVAGNFQKMSPLHHYSPKRSIQK